MKKLILLLVIIPSIIIYSQSKFVAGASFNVGFPTSSFSKEATTGIGGSIIGEYFINKIEEDKRKLKELKTDDENLEKFAREQYRMKKADEDLYIILTPHEDRKISRKQR